MLSVGRIFIKPVKVDTVCGFSVGHLLHKINYDVKRATILLTNNKLIMNASIHKKTNVTNAN